ncbi:ATP-dependent nuclease [Cobetia crustatorum]|uniref:ATP-dependent nuclease n=1 Tax=Cobetia crustatorum TaxID=553385 RepID=UPI0004B6DE41|nr:TOPRIM nucleotidyl transferase/hydrolase domain-containing protein [Cobetia crustatorum]
MSNDEPIQALFNHSAEVIDQDDSGTAVYNLVFRPKASIRQKLAKIEDGDFEELERIRESITIEDYETEYTGRSSIDFTIPVNYMMVVGDFNNCKFNGVVNTSLAGVKLPRYLSLSKDISFTYIQALRDVVSEFRNNRTNPLLALLKVKSGDISEVTMQPIVDKVLELNESIESLDEVQSVRSDILSTIKDAAGETYAPRSLSVKSDLPEEADKLFKSLKLFVGESEDDYEDNISELSLGGANLIFLTLKLLEFKYKKEEDAIAKFLIIEEPEAHIHTHIQKTLFDRIGYHNTQIIYSTHSTHLSEVSNIKNINIITKGSNGCEVYQPANNLSASEIRNLQRYLDAVRSNLLFAKSTILVEGDAEEILIPIMFKQVTGLSLDELGISLINIRSTGFKNIAILFNDCRIKKYCSIITDLDAAFIDTTYSETDTSSLEKRKSKYAGSQSKGASRQKDLDSFVSGNNWLSVFYAEHTFEVDFIKSGNYRYIDKIIEDVYTSQSTIDLSKQELSSGNIELYGQRVLTMAESLGKGWFAILLGSKIDYRTIIPAYIWKAILASQKSLTIEQYASIYNYRLKKLYADQIVEVDKYCEAMSYIESYKSRHIALMEFKSLMSSYLKNDQINEILEEIN